MIDLRAELLRKWSRMIPVPIKFDPTLLEVTVGDMHIAKCVIDARGTEVLVRDYNPVSEGRTIT